MSEEKVLATVAGKSITDADVDAFISTLQPQQQAYAKNPQFRNQVLNQVVSLELLAKHGEDQKLDETPEFQKAMETARRDILAQIAVSYIVKDVTVSEEEAAAYYEQNKAKYGQGASVSAKHILVDDEKKLQQIIDSINAGEITFEEAAKANSTCGSASQGGDLGKFGPGQMVPEFEKAAFSAELNTIVGPVKTQFGYHAIKVYDKTEAATAPFAEVKGKVMSELKQQKQEAAYRQALTELGAKYVEY